MSLPFYYRKAPVLIQSLMLNIYAFFLKKRRYSKGFYKALSFFENSNPEEIDKEQLYKFLKNAEKSPFWKERFLKYGFSADAEDIETELQKLPILTKQEVVENTQAIKIKVKEERVYACKTGGTTGAGLVFCQTQNMENKQWAVWWRYRKRFGITQNLWIGWFAGKLIIPIEQNSPPYHRINFPMKQVMFSAFHLKLDTVDTYYRVLKKKKIKWLHGYPSQISLLASLIKQKGLANLEMEYVSTGAESLLEHQKKIIEEVFGVCPIEHYGLAEGTSNISQLPDGTMQVDNDFAYTEFIASKQFNNKYHIVGTNYSNLSFPLIRYDAGDLASLKADEKSKKIVQAIEGRNEDFIVLPGRVKIATAALSLIFKNFTFIRETQVYQPTPDKIIFRIVKGNGYSERQHEKMIISEARAYLGKEVSIDIVYLDAIARTKSGKLKFAISDVN